MMNQLYTRNDFESWLNLYPHVKRVQIVEVPGTGKVKVFITVGFWYWLLFGNALWKKLQPIAEYYSPSRVEPLIIITTKI